MATKTKSRNIIDGEPVIFNVGYQGRKVEEFILLLSNKKQELS